MKVLINVFVGTRKREYEVTANAYGRDVILKPVDRDDPVLSVNMVDLENAYRAVRDAVEG